MKLAILETDELRPALRPSYTSYGKMFQTLFQQVGVDWEMSVFSVISEEYPADINDFDAYLITGSQHDAYSDTDWIVRLRSYVNTLFKAKKPLLGICFGHQLIAHALGGEAKQAEVGWGLGVMSYNRLLDVPFADDQANVSLLISHRDQVSRLPDGAQTLLGNDFCPYAAFFIPGRLLCFQGHPEFDKAYGKALLSYRLDDISTEHLEQIEASYSQPHEGVRIGRWMKNFLEQTLAQGT